MKKTILKILIIGFIFITFIPLVIYADSIIPATYYGDKIINLAKFSEYIFFNNTFLPFNQKINETGYFWEYPLGFTSVEIPNSDSSNLFVYALQKEDYYKLPRAVFFGNYEQDQQILKELKDNGKLIVSRNQREYLKRSSSYGPKESIIGTYEVINFSKDGFDLKKIETIRSGERVGLEKKLLPLNSDILKNLGLPMIIGLLLGVVIGLIIVRTSHKKNKIDW